MEARPDRTPSAFLFVGTWHKLLPGFKMMEKNEGVYIDRPRRGWAFKSG